MKSSKENKMALEEQLMDDARNGREIERALLIASGLETEEKIAEYKAKIDELDRQFREYAGITKNEEETAILLHEFLWHEKPKRYNKQVCLTDVIDAQISTETEGVGNCVGLSSLYAVLGIRNGLILNVLDSKRHVMLRLKTHRQDIDIECTSRYGYGGLTAEDYRREGVIGLKEGRLIRLVGNIYAYMGFVKADANKTEEAITLYSRAIEIIPDEKELYALRAEANEMLGRDVEAIIDYGKLIELSPREQSAYARRRRIKQKLGDEEGAKKDFQIEFNLEMDRRYAAIGTKWEWQ